MKPEEITATIGAHYARQATPEVWAEVDELRARVAKHGMTDKERETIAALREGYPKALREVARGFSARAVEQANTCRHAAYLIEYLCDELLNSR